MSDETNQPASSSEPQANYDDPWKEALELYFEPFLDFFFPAVHELIDWSRSYESLEQEFQQFLKESELGKRFTDKLFKVWQHNGEATWILVHVEVQSQEESDFAQRMFVYNYRCFDRYRKPVISLAVLGDARLNWRPSSYGYALGGCRVGIEFPIAKLMDYETRWQELEQSQNPFAIVVMAHLKTKATIRKSQQRQRWKWTLVRKLFEEGYSRNDIVQLFRLVDWMMTLPEGLEREFQAQLRQYQEERQVPYITSVERFAKADGIVEGRLEALRESVIDILQLRFDSVPASIAEILNSLEDSALLKRLNLQAVTIGSLEEFQQILSAS